MPTEHLAWEIADTAHSVRRAFDRRALKLGVTRAQWRLMLRLAASPSLRQVEVAELLDIEPITLCRIVDRLEEAGLVERQRDPSDRRAWLLNLTQRAEPLLEKLRAIATELSAEAFGGLELAQIDALRSGLARIRDNLSQSTDTQNRVSA